MYLIVINEGFNTVNYCYMAVDKDRDEEDITYSYEKIVSSIKGHTGSLDIIKERSCE